MKKFREVLLVDDDETSNFITSLVLKNYNNRIKIITKLNGEQAIDHLNGCEGKIPCLALLDINMPKMNGLEFLNWFSTSNFSNKMKIAMYTTSLRPSEVKETQSYKDVVDYVEKPLTVDVLMTLTKRINGK